VALVAVEATKDLWAAFVRTMGVPMDQRAAMAQQEATTLADHWLSYSKPDMLAWYDDEAHRDSTYVLAAGQSGKGVTQEQCMSLLAKGKTQAQFVQALEATQRQCLYNAIPWSGYSDQADPQLHIWYSWRWRNGGLPISDPPADWKIPDLVADTGLRVRIKSLANQKYMIAESGLKDGSLIYNRDGTPIDFILVGTTGEARFRATFNPMLFLDYRAASGAVKLYAPGTNDPASYDLPPAGQGRALKSLYWKQYIWLSGDEPYLTRSGNPKNLNAQWNIEGLK
jgi:hypothetical protein